MIDLGAGHGLISRALAKDFTEVIGTDPSKGMIEQAVSRTTSAEFPNVGYREASAESLPFAKDGSVDMVVAGQAAHWFDYPRLFAELRRVVRPGGTMAFWGYKDPLFADHPKASELLAHFFYDMEPNALGPYWQQPGRSIVQKKLRPINPPTTEWEDVRRVEYEPASNGKGSGEGTIFLEMRVNLARFAEYVRTFSSYHGWKEAHPDTKRRSEGGEGDNVDELFDEIVQSEEAFREAGKDWPEKIVDIEWGSGLLLARKK